MGPLPGFSSAWVTCQHAWSMRGCATDVVVAQVVVLVQLGHVASQHGVHVQAGQLLEQVVVRVAQQAIVARKLQLALAVLLDVAQQAAQEAALHARRLHEPGQLQDRGARSQTIRAPPSNHDTMHSDVIMLCRGRQICIVACCCLAIQCHKACGRSRKHKG